MGELAAKLYDFRKRLLPARNKLISHYDRVAIAAGVPLGGARDTEWSGFWRNLDRLVNTMHEAATGEPLHILGIALPSDAENLLRSLRSAEYFLQLWREGDTGLKQKCARLGGFP
jgi:hypothetical protein